MYGAMAYAMNQRVDGEQIEMGWRQNAAKVLLPVGDEPPDDPDWEGRELSDIARIARNLDPVHFYPLILPKQGTVFLDPTVRAMERIARATNGTIVKVGKADDLPTALVDTVKLAIRRHRNEVWRKGNPPYTLYGTLGVIIVIALLTAFRGILRAGTTTVKPPGNGR